MRVLCIDIGIGFVSMSPDRVTDLYQLEQLNIHTVLDILFFIRLLSSACRPHIDMAHMFCSLSSLPCAPSTDARDRHCQAASMTLSCWQMAVTAARWIPVG